MIRTLAAPNKYFQGPDILKSLFTYIGYIGKRFLLLSDETVYEIVKDKVASGFKDSQAEWEFVLFGGESTQGEADRISAIALGKNYDGIIGIGGGKVMDTAKLVSDICGLPIVIIPTAAATDAPCSAMSVVYDENGTFVVSKRMKRNPDVVLVDTQIIANAPLRTFIAGIGDAFACYYEARACKKAGAQNYTGGIGTEAAFAMAELCNKMLLENGVEAKNSVANKCWSLALEKTIEANIYLGGVGFENNGCAIAHGVYNGMTAVIKPFKAMHGEAVAVGTLIQLAAEKIDEKEYEAIIRFFREVGLPTNLEGLGIENATDELIRKVAESSCKVGSNVHKMPFEVTPELLFNAIKVVQDREIY